MDDSTPKVIYALLGSISTLSPPKKVVLTLLYSAFPATSNVPFILVESAEVNGIETCASVPDTDATVKRPLT